MSGGTNVATARIAVVDVVDELVRVSLEGWPQAEEVPSTAIRTFKVVLVYLSLYFALNRIAASTPSLSPEWYGADDVAALSIPAISPEGVSDEEDTQDLGLGEEYAALKGLMPRFVALYARLGTRGAAALMESEPGFNDVSPEQFWGRLRQLGDRNRIKRVLTSLVREDADISAKHAECEVPLFVSAIVGRLLDGGFELPDPGECEDAQEPPKERETLRNAHAPGRVVPKPKPRLRTEGRNEPVCG